MRPLTFWTGREVDVKASTLDGLVRYRDDHCPVGSFLQAVLENKLMEAIGRADEENLRGISEIANFVYWDMPAVCHGSEERVSGWLEMGYRKREEERKRREERENAPSVG